MLTVLTAGGCRAGSADHPLANAVPMRRAGLVVGVVFAELRARG